jgi:phosphate transport system substrate-binding protein
MQELKTSRRAKLLAGVGLLAAVSAIGAGCSSSKPSASTSSTTGGSSTTASTVAVPSGTLNGSGSTFQLNFDQDAIAAFDQAHSGVTINYGGGGSGKGQTDLLNHLVDFAGTDSLPKNASSYTGGILYFPTVAAPITLSYNLSGVKDLTLSATTIAKIFLGQIKSWSDPAIAADNPGVSLPSTSITPVHRSDGSGTTSNFTKYLEKAAPSAWTLGHGNTVAWPGGQAASGNPGVASVIKQTSGAIGYVDFSTAKASGLTVASVKNSSGTAVPPSLAGASAAVGGATIAADLTYDPTNATASGAYPITSPTWIIVYKTQSDPTKAAILKAFLQYLLTTAQTTVAQQDNYAPLPQSLDQMALAQLNQL